MPVKVVQQFAVAAFPPDKVAAARLPMSAAAMRILLVIELAAACPSLKTARDIRRPVFVGELHRAELVKSDLWVPFEVRVAMWSRLVAVLRL